MIKVVKRLITFKMLSPGDYLPLPLGYIMHMYKIIWILNVIFSDQYIFTRFHMGPSIKGV